MAFRFRIKNYRQLLILSVLAFGWLAQVGAVQAQEQGKEYQAGPYRVRVTYDRNPLKSGQDFYMTVERLDAASPDWQLQVESLPVRISATPVKAEGDFQTSDPTKRLVKTQLPISGTWQIVLTLSGSAGRQQVQIPARAEPPPAMETWLAWLIGLSPVVGFIGFAIGQYRFVQKRRRVAKMQDPPAITA